MTDTIYVYDKNNGLFTGLYTLRQDPKTKKNLKPPSNSTSKHPPAPEKGKVAAFKGDAWQMIEDHRGELAYNAKGQQVKIQQPGPLPQELSTQDPTHTPPSWGERLHNYKARLEQEAERARRGLVSSCPLKALEYQLCYDQARAYTDANYQGQPPAVVKSDMDAFKHTKQQACQQIIQKNSMFLSLIEAIRHDRLKYKTQLKALKADSDTEAEQIIKKHAEAAKKYNYEI